MTALLIAEIICQTQKSNTCDFGVERDFNNATHTHIFSLCALVFIMEFCFTNIHNPTIFCGNNSYFILNITYVDNYIIL